MDKIEAERRRCRECAQGKPLDFDFSFAFQPVVDADARQVVSHEALVRGPAGEPAFSVLGQVDDDNRYRFDQLCRRKAIEAAARVGVASSLNINFYPNAVYEPERCIRTTLKAARDTGFPVERIVLEVTEGEKVKDVAHLVEIIRAYRALGFRTAIDDFGAGYSGLNLLAQYQPDIIKLDRAMIQDIQLHRPKQAIVKGVVGFCQELSIEIVAEGVETRDEFAWLRDAGIRLFQGYHFARPAFEALPAVADSVFDF